MEQQDQDPLAGIPELHSYLARTETDKTAALKLVADSVAQMRQAANTALIFHPLNIALAVGLMSIFARYIYNLKHDWSLVATSCAGVIMALLAGYRWCTQGYLAAAESVDWDFIEGSDVLVTKFGEETIGALVVDWISGESSRQKKKKAWRGEIRAWTVKLRYRGKGVGAALLEDAVREARKKGAESLEFAEDHASEYCFVLDGRFSMGYADFLCRRQARVACDIQHQIRRAREPLARAAAGFTGSESDSWQEEMNELEKINGKDFLLTRHNTLDIYPSYFT